MEKSLVAIRAVLATTPSRWQSLVAMIPAAVLEHNPLPGEWSALDCLRHLVETETSLYPVRVRQFLAGEDFAAFDPDAAAAQAPIEPAEVLVTRFAQTRDASLVLFDQLQPEDMSRTVNHPALGQVTLLQMLHTWAGHDLMHTVQAERSMMQPFIVGCGPWHGFFKDHAV